MSRGLVRLRVAVALATVTVLALAGCGSSDEPEASDGGAAGVVQSGSGDEGPYAGMEIDPPYPMPSTTLTDTDGEQTHVPADLDAPVRLFFYGYTHCPDVCPLIMSDLALAVARLPDDAADDVEVVLVTSDPSRDDPATMRAYLDRFDPDFTGLTGDLDTIIEFADGMGVPIVDGAKLPSGGYEVSHGAQVVGFAGDRGVVVWTESASTEDIASDLALLVDTAADDGDG